MAPHLKVGLGDIHPIVLTVGDPFRCDLVAGMCEFAKEIKWNREYRLFNVKYAGVDMTICSHGIGGPGAAICFEELIKVGAQVIIRMGTCGSLKPDIIRQGELIVTTGACREDGHSSWLVPAGFPAVSDPRICLSLYETAKAQGYKVHMGPTLTSGSFYPGPAMASTLQTNADAGAISVEMENATLFCVGTLRGIMTGAIGTIDGSPFNWEGGDYDPHGKIVAEGKERMIKVGLSVGSELAKKYGGSFKNPGQKEQQDFFSEEEVEHLMEVYHEKHAFDFVMGIEGLKASQRAKIFELIKKGVFSNLQIYLDNATDMSEAQIKDLIVLFYKVQRGMDSSFLKTAAAYCESHTGNA